MRRLLENTILFAAALCISAVAMGIIDTFGTLAVPLSVLFIEMMIDLIAWQMRRSR